MYIAFESFFYSSSAFRLLLKWVSTPNACEKHDSWRHGPREGPVDRMRVVDPEETRFCSFDTSKNKSRKRRICLPCRGRIAVEIKCSKLEVSQTVLHAYIFVVFDRCEINFLSVH